ncbi:MAG: hypothetical protein MJ252_31075, partial [archaeon]|nr:hypothetical protein [archaeon]
FFHTVISYLGKTISFSIFLYTHIFLSSLFFAFSISPFLPPISLSAVNAPLIKAFLSFVFAYYKLQIYFLLCLYINSSYT